MMIDRSTNILWISDGACCMPTVNFLAGIHYICGVPSVPGPVTAKFCWWNWQTCLLCYSNTICLLCGATFPVHLSTPLACPACMHKYIIIWACSGITTMAIDAHIQLIHNFFQVYIYTCCHSCPSINAIGPAPLRGGLKNINRSTMLICIANAPSLLQKHSNCLAHKCMLIIPQITRNKSSHLLFV
jgi:hypothetical protein